MAIGPSHSYSENDLRHQQNQKSFKKRTKDITEDFFINEFISNDITGNIRNSSGRSKTVSIPKFAIQSIHPTTQKRSVALNKDKTAQDSY